jgi:hypothetical protein
MSPHGPLELRTDALVAFIIVAVVALILQR